MKIYEEIKKLYPTQLLNFSAWYWMNKVYPHPQTTKEKWIEINNKLAQAARLPNSSWFTFEKWDKETSPEDKLKAFKIADL